LTKITTGGKTTNWISPWSENGKYLSFSSNKNNPAGMDCYLYDVQGGSSELFVENQGIGLITDFDSDNFQGLLYRLVSRGSNDMYLIDKDGNETILTQHTGPGNIYGRFSPTGEIYMTSDLDRDLIAFGKVVDGKIEILNERANSELENLIINHTGSKALLIWNVGGKNEVSLFDLQSTRKCLLLLPICLA